jgi:hypothetical protein
MKTRAPSFAPLLLAFAACTSATDNRLPADAEAALRSARTMELFALDPTPLRLGVPQPEKGAFHDYPILGRASLTDAVQAKALGELVLRGIRESDGKVAACFNPRHGIRVEQNGKTLDVVICYECLSLSVHGDLLGSADARIGLLTAERVEPAVTAIFQGAGLTILGK